MTNFLPILDRYILWLFLKVLLISFMSLTGLFIVIDGFGNLEEFITYGELQGGILWVLLDYYSPRVLSFFDRINPLLALISAMFAITWMQRNNELTALMAAGISQVRVVKPLIVAVVTVSLLGVANREFVLPQVQDKLSRNAQNWLGDNPRPLQPRYDNNTDILLGGRHTVAAERTILRPNFRLPRRMGGFGRQLVAAKAYHRPPQGDRPGGYLLDAVEQPAGLAELPSLSWEGRPLILSPHDTSWLEADQCFVVSDVDFEHLAAGSQWRQHASSRQLMSELRKASLDYGADMRVTLHVRMVQPLLDLTLFLLGLPLVLTRESRNLFVSAGLCVLLVAGFFVVVLACHALGNHGYLLSPALAAWCPLILFVPLAYGAARPLWQ